LERKQYFFRTNNVSIRNPDEKSAEKQATTLGRQSKLQEGHYLHHFSINPKNLSEVVKLAGSDANDINNDDVEKLKEAMRRGVSYYDSASKAGSENEALVWVQLKESSKLVLPNFTQLLKMEAEKENGKVIIDCKKLKEKIEMHKDEIETIQIYYNESAVIINNVPESAKLLSI
jgi:CRISPR-associated protein Csh2